MKAAYFCTLCLVLVMLTRTGAQSNIADPFVSGLRLGIDSMMHNLRNMLRDMRADIATRGGQGEAIAADQQEPNAAGLSGEVREMFGIMQANMERQMAAISDRLQEANNAGLSPGDVQASLPFNAGDLSLLANGAIGEGLDVDLDGAGSGFR